MNSYFKTFSSIFMYPMERSSKPRLLAANNAIFYRSRAPVTQSLVPPNRSNYSLAFLLPPMCLRGVLHPPMLILRTQNICNDIHWLQLSCIILLLLDLKSPLGPAGHSIFSRPARVAAADLMGSLLEMRLLHAELLWGVIAGKEEL